MKDNKKLIYLVLVIALIVVMVAFSTYAFFLNANNLETNVPLNVTTVGKSAFTASSEGDIALDISMEKMEQSKATNNIVDTDNATVTVSLDSGSENETMSCTYDIVWVWDSEDKYTESDVELPYIKNDVTYPYELSASVDGTDEKDLGTLTWKTVREKQEAVIANKEIKVYGKGSKTITHQIDVQVYNIPIIQQNLFNKKFQAHIEVKNYTCTGGQTLIVNYILDEVYTEDGENGLYYHDGVGTYTNANLEAGDNSYRYSGTNPDNYLCFKAGCTDDEKYRIIGIIDNKVKVIKMTNDGNRKWNSSNVSTWTGDTLETYLNGEYLTKLGTDAELIDTTTWHVGGYYNIHKIQEVYTAELTSAPTIDRKVGLMYVNDYLYAADPTQWNTDTYSFTSSQNWMFSSDMPWTISKVNGYVNTVIYIKSSGGLDSNGVTAELAVYPVFSLLSSVKYASGSGTSADPLIVSL